jgi:hypothetical protein
MKTLKVNLRSQDVTKNPNNATASKFLAEHITPIMREVPAFFVSEYWVKFPVIYGTKHLNANQRAKVNSFLTLAKSAQRWFDVYEDSRHEVLMAFATTDVPTVTEGRTTHTYY